MYRITYGCGNGYHCGCCRSTWDETVDCATKEEVVEWLSDLEADKQCPSCEDADDRWLIEIREIKDENLTKSFQADPERVKQIVAATQAREKKREQEREEATRQREIEELKSLQRRYPDE